MKRTIFILVMLFPSVIFLCFTSTELYHEQVVANVISKKENRPKVSWNKMKQKSVEAELFCTEKKFNTHYCMLIDMSLHSGIKRFFVWDFQKDTVVFSCLVGHGCCDNVWNTDNTKDNPRFSNVDGSHCSSIGKYKIGERGHSDWGIGVKYVLHGLEKTNNNALSRFVVFHSWERVSDKEVYPEGTPEGWGCPIVSDNSMKKMDALLRQSNKPVLMWLYK
jgi:hypothetical protein